MRRSPSMPKAPIHLDAWDKMIPSLWFSEISENEQFRRRYLTKLFDELRSTVPELKRTFRYLQPMTSLLSGHDWISLAVAARDIYERHRQPECLVRSLVAVAAAELDIAKFQMYQFYCHDLCDEGISGHEVVHAIGRRDQWLMSIKNSPLENPSSWNFSSGGLLSTLAKALGERFIAVN
jgi:hypothetical protein